MLLHVVTCLSRFSNVGQADTQVMLWHNPYKPDHGGLTWKAIKARSVLHDQRPVVSPLHHVAEVC